MLTVEKRICKAVNKESWDFIYSQTERKKERPKDYRQEMYAYSPILKV